MISLMFDEADVAMWSKLLGQAAQERDPEKLAGILALIETAARAERLDLERRSGSRHEPHRHSTRGTVESHPWSTLLASEDDPVLLAANPARNSELYLRYLRLADCALGGGKTASDEAKKKRKAA